MKINNFTKFLMRFFPSLFVRLAAKEEGVPYHLIEKSFDLFGRGESKRIDFFPTSGGRGFIIIIDRKLSLHFYQNGDSFYYDGWEIGEYEKGDVTIFDRI